MERNDKTPTDSTPQNADDIFGYMANQVKIIGDIVGPTTPPDDWQCI